MTAAIPLLIRALSAEAASYAAEGIASEMGNIGRERTAPGIEQEVFPEGLRAVLHHPIAIAAITARCQMVVDHANAMKVRRTAEYEMLLQNWPDSTRARAFCRPANAAAFYDDKIFSTMLKAAAAVPSDPKQ